MKDRFKKLSRDRIVKQSYLLSLALVILTFLYILFFYRQLPPLIPLYNQLSWGLQRLGQKNMILLPLGINAAIIFINLFFSQLVYEKMPLVVRMISITSLFISIIVCMFTIRTTLLVL